MALGKLFRFLGGLINGMFPSRIKYTKEFCLQNHTPFLIRYRGPTQTHVIVSVYTRKTSSSSSRSRSRSDSSGSGNLPSTRTVYLQKQGWRVGLFGETFAKVLGWNWSSSSSSSSSSRRKSSQGLVEVTPTHECQWSPPKTLSSSSGGDVISYQDQGQNQDALVKMCQEEGLSKSQCQNIQQQIGQFSNAQSQSQSQSQISTTTTNTRAANTLPTYEYCETWVIRIPPIVDDGYYTIRLALSPSKNPIAFTSPFRIYSSSLSTASPRGASLPLLLPLELLFKSLCTTLKAFLLAALPFAKLCSLLPGRWGQRLVNWCWSNLLGQQEWVQDLKQNQHVQQVWKTMGKADRSLPWSKMGIRRAHHVTESDIQRRGIVIHF